MEIGVRNFVNLNENLPHNPDSLCQRTKHCTLQILASVHCYSSHNSQEGKQPKIPTSPEWIENALNTNNGITLEYKENYPLPSSPH